MERFLALDAKFRSRPHKITQPWDLGLIGANEWLVKGWGEVRSKPIGEDRRKVGKTPFLGARGNRGGV